MSNTGYMVFLIILVEHLVVIIQLTADILKMAIGMFIMIPGTKF